MSFLNQQIEIDQYMTANWPHTQIARDNQSFNPKQLTEWIRVSVLDGNTRQTSFGPPKSFRFFGIVSIQIFVLINVGSGRALELADIAFQLFKTQNIGSSTFETPELIRLGSLDGQWYQINVDCPFYREEFE